ncbi:MAG: HD domain-containing protein [Rhizomicrobium sp.]
MNTSGDALSFDALDDLETVFAAMAEMQCEEPGLSELDHALQCAAELRAVTPDDEELQIAGLLHDIGSGRCTSSLHGAVGGRAIRPLLGARIADLVRLHVDAKRYLVTTDPAYAANLSRVSVHTLGLQGGAMSAAEIASFESERCWSDALMLRRADERAKTPGRGVPGIESWLPVLRRVAQRGS